MRHDVDRGPSGTISGKGGGSDASIIRRLFPLLLCVLSMVVSVPAYAGLGGETVSPFPAIDAKVGKQEARVSVVDTDGNVIVTGYQNLTGGTNDDYYTVKFKADGSGIAWQASFDKAGGSDVATAVAVDGNNDVIVTGYAWNGVNNDIHTIKYDGVTGAVLWQHTFNGAAGGNDVGTSIAADSANNIYVGGYSQNAAGNDDYLILKYAPGGGAPAWQEIYNGPANGIDRITAIATGIDGIAVTGYSWNGAKFDILTRKYGFDKTFLKEWRYSSPGTTNPDTGQFVKMDASGNVIITGYVSNNSDFDIYTAKYNAATGAVVWQRTYDGGFEDEPKGLSVDAAGDVYITGYTWTLAGRYEFYTVRYSGAAGSTVWQKTFGSGENNDDVTVPSGIAVDEAGGAVYVTGYTYKFLEGNYDFQLIKYHKDSGHQLWQASFDGAAHKDDEPVGIGLSPSGDVLVAGWSDKGTSGATDYDYLVIKFDKGVLNPPTGLVATAASNTTINLAWEDNSVNEDGFILERKLGEAGSWAEVTTVPYPLTVNTTTYTDTGLTPDNYYYYRIKAIKSGNISSHYSNEAHALTKVVSYDQPVWTYLFNGPDNREEYAEAISVGPDDNPVVTGRSDLREVGVDPPAFSFDYYTVKLNRADKSVIWDAVYDSGDGGYDTAKTVAVNGNNEVFVSGNAYLFWPGAITNTNDIFTIKYPSTGPPEVWHNQYNGPAGGDDRSTSIATAVDGSNNIAVVGYGINAANNTDIYVIKLSATPVINDKGNAVPLWTATPYDGGGNDYPNAVAFDPAGNVFVAGYTHNGSNYDWFVAKYDGATGARLWTDIYNGAGNGDDAARALAVDSQGNAYVTGYMTNAAGKREFRTVKYDGATSPTKRRIWEKSYNGPMGGDDEAVAIKIDPITGNNPLDGNVIVAGTQLTAPGNRDFHLIRYRASDGQVMWERNFDRPDNDDVVKGMVIDSSGYLYVAGDTSNGLTNDIMSLIYDYEGTFLGATIYNGAANDFDEAKDVTVNYQGEAFIAGYSTNAGGNADYAVVKQKNNYILVPAPFTSMAQADYSRVNLAWRGNTPGTGYRIRRTLGPSTPISVWTDLPEVAPGVTAYQDTGLNPNTYYCYQIDAFSGSLNSRKIETCVTTTQQKPVSAPLVVNSTTQITVSWTNVSGNTGYKIERKVGTGAWTDLTVTAADVTSYPDTGLTAGTLYVYRISTRNISGYSLPSDEQTASTLPVAPVLNTPTGITVSKVDLSWNNVVGETGYKIERKEGAGGTWQQVGTTLQDITTYSDAGLTANTQYYYRVKAYNASGDSAPSNELPALTQFISPTLTGATAVSATQINLEWADVTGESGYTIQESVCSYPHYPIYCSQYDWAWGGWYQVGTTAADVTSYQRTGLTSANNYRYQIVATVTGNSSAPSNASAAWTWLTARTLTLTPATETALTLTWNDANGETNYTVERKPGSEGTWAEVPAGTGLGINTVTFTDTGLGLQTSYCYRVKAYSTVPSPPPYVYSNEVCMTTPLSAPALNPLTVPSTTQIDLSWTNVVGNSGYEVERCTTNYPDNPEYAWNYPGQAWVWNAGSCTVTALPADTISYSSTGLTSGYTYRYRVRDTYTGGVSGWSSEKYATTISPAPTVLTPVALSTTQMNVYWSNVYGDTGYKLEWKECAGGTWSTPISIPESTSQQYIYGQYAWYYTLSGLKEGTVYYFKIRATNTWGDSAYSNELSQITLLSPPTLNAPTGITTSSMNLSWNNIAGNTGYKIERKTGAGGTWAQVGTTAADVASYGDTGLAAGTLYYYRVKASNAGGDSATSNEQSATTTPAKPLVSLAAVSAGEVDLSWVVVYGATNYKIKRKTGAGGTYSDLVNLTIGYAESYCGYPAPTVACPNPSPMATGQHDTGLSENTTYCYQVTAWNLTGGDSLPSDEKCITTASLPSANLTATALNAAKIRLDWVPGTCSQGQCDTPDGFEIERQMWNGKFAKIANVTGTSTATYTNAVGIDPNTVYTYRVRPYRGIISDFNSGIDSAVWNQRGVIRNTSNVIVQDVTTPPVNVVDGANGAARITASGGLVQMNTVSPGGGLGDSYNFSRILFKDPSVIHNDFDISVDYTLPDGQVSASQYHVYGRLQTNFLNTTGGTDYVYVERSVGSGNMYVVVAFIEGITKSVSIPTNDVFGKLRIVRGGNKVSAYVWTNGAWTLLSEVPSTSTAPATHIGVTQYVQRNEAVNLKINIDNFAAVTDKSAYSNEASAKTPDFTQGANTCP